MRGDSLPGEHAAEANTEEAKSCRKGHPMTRAPIEPATDIDSNQRRNHHQPAESHHGDRSADDAVLLSTMTLTTGVQTLRRLG